MIKSKFNKSLYISALCVLVAHGLLVYLLLKSNPHQIISYKNKQIVSIGIRLKEEKPKLSNYLAEREQTAKKQTKSLSSSRKKEDPKGLFKMMDEEIGKYKGQEFHDGLNDVEEGERTKLNTLQFRHAAFFNRIKASIGRIWSPQRQIDIYDPKGQLLGLEDKRTQTKIMINKDGHLTSVSIINSSGVAYLDEEALRAIRLASPFLYPPKELFLTKDYFSFHFSFYLIINRGFSLGFN